MNTRHWPSQVRVAAGLLACAMALGFIGCEKESPKEPTKAPQQESDVTGEFVNSLCPIMGSKIDPAKVPADLVREFKGQKVAFCCSGCTVVWDKLSDEERQAKLDKVMSALKEAEPGDVMPGD